MVYRLLAINVDGALLSSKGKVHRATKDALKEVVRKGVEIVLFSSSSYQHVQRVAKQLSISPYLISNSGACIMKKNLKPIVAKSIAATTAFDIARLLENMDCHMRFVHYDQTVVNSVHFQNDPASKVKWMLDDYTFYTQNYVESLVDFLTVEQIEPQQIDVHFESEADYLEALKMLNNIFEGISIQRLDDLRFTIFPEGVSIFETVKDIAVFLGVNKPEMVAIGCSKLDAELVSYAGVGIAMANAHQDVKEVAQWCTRSSDALGVAYVVKELFRSQPRLSLLEKIRSEK